MCRPGIVVSGIALFQRLFLCNFYLFFEAGEHFFHICLVHLPGEKADDGNDDETAYHGDYAGVNGGFEDVVKEGAATGHVKELQALQKLDDCDDGTPCIADSDGSLCDALPVQTVEERSEESTCESTP